MFVVGVAGPLSPLTSLMLVPIRKRRFYPRTNFTGLGSDRIRSNPSSLMTSFDRACDFFVVERLSIYERIYRPGSPMPADLGAKLSRALQPLQNVSLCILMPLQCRERTLIWHRRERPEYQPRQVAGRRFSRCRREERQQRRRRAPLRSSRQRAEPLG